MILSQEQKVVGPLGVITGFGKGKTTTEIVSKFVQPLASLTLTIYVVEVPGLAFTLS